MMPLLLGLLAGSTVFILFGPGSPPWRPSRLARLYARMGAQPPPTQKTGKGPWVRKLHLGPLVALVKPWLSRRYRMAVEHRLQIARLDSTYTFDDLLAMKLGAALGACFYGFLLYLKAKDPLLFLPFLMLGGLGFILPDNWLRTKAKRRQDAIQRELPAFLSALAVAVEAGLNLMAAISEVVRDRTGVLASELREAVELYERGLEPAAALERIALRLEVPELTVQLSTLLQAFAKGSGHVVDMVRRQAAEAWEKRRRQAEAMAQSASIKLFLPIALLALPGFMIFLLGPAVLEILDYMTHR